MRAWIVAAVGALISFLSVWLLGSERSKRKAAEKRHEEYRDTRERMDDAFHGSDPDAARRWLRERDER